MEIKTKFNIGEKVWLLKGNKARNSFVKQIRACVTTVPDKSGWELSAAVSVKYIVDCDCFSEENEDSLFKTKEDLLKSL